MRPCAAPLLAPGTFTQLFRSVPVTFSTDRDPARASGRIRRVAKPCPPGPRKPPPTSWQREPRGSEASDAIFALVLGKPAPRGSDRTTTRAALPAVLSMPPVQGPAHACAKGQASVGNNGLRWLSNPKRADPLYITQARPPRNDATHQIRKHFSSPPPFSRTQLDRQTHLLRASCRSLPLI